MSKDKKGNHIKELAHIFGAVGLSPSRRINKVLS